MTPKQIPLGTQRLQVDAALVKTRQSKVSLKEIDMRRLGHEMRSRVKTAREQADHQIFLLEDILKQDREAS